MTIPFYHFPDCRAEGAIRVAAQLTNPPSLLSWAHRNVTTVDASVYPFHND